MIGKEESQKTTSFVANYQFDKNYHNDKLRGKLIKHCLK